MGYHRCRLINDDSNEVGRVHFGIVHVLETENQCVKAKEQSMNEAGFVPLQVIRANVIKYESWSQICLSNVDLLKPYACG